MSVGASHAFVNGCVGSRPLAHVGQISPPSASSSSFASSIAARAAASMTGNLGSICTSSSRITAAADRRISHFRSAGITYHGACSVLVWLSTSAKACW